MIPKIIHYCWFGNSPMPQKHKDNIIKWKEILPDYKIMCWDESSIDIESIPFLKQAYEEKKWAFVADYTRLYALSKFGGIYMDTDVIVKKSFNPFLHHSFFTSYEYHPAYKHMEQIYNMIDENGFRRKGIDPMEKIPGVGLMSAIIASEPQCKYVNDVLCWYNEMTFHENRKYNYTIPTTLAIVAEKYGFRYVNEKQILQNNIIIYPSNIFADYRTADKNSYAVHMCVGSWADAHNVKNKVHKFLYNKFYKIRWMRKTYLTIRNLFSKYKVMY